MFTVTNNVVMKSFCLKVCSVLEPKSYNSRDGIEAPGTSGTWQGADEGSEAGLQDRVPPTSGHLAEVGDHCLTSSQGLALLHSLPTSSDRTPPTLDRCVTGPGTLSLRKPSFLSGKAANHGAESWGRSCGLGRDKLGVRRARCPSEWSPAQPQGMSSVLPLPQQTGLADQDCYPISSRNNSGTGPWTGSSQLPAPLPQPSVHRAALPLSQASVQPPCPSHQPHAGGLSSPRRRAELPPPPASASPRPPSPDVTQGHRGPSGTASCQAWCRVLSSRAECKHPGPERTSVWGTRTNPLVLPGTTSHLSTGLRPCGQRGPQRRLLGAVSGLLRKRGGLLTAPLPAGVRSDVTTSHRLGITSAKRPHNTD